MLLENLTNGKESSNIIVLEDNCNVRGESLIKSIINGLSQRVEEIHLFLLEYLPSSLLHGLSQSVTQRLHIHDVASDPLGWNGNTQITMETNFIEYIANLTMSSGNIGIVVDCLSNLILHRSVAYTCQFLHRCRKHASDDHDITVVAMVHKGLHDNGVLAKLHHTATSVLDLHPAQDRSYHGVCRILHKKATGKVINQMEQFKISSHFELVDVVEVRGKLIDEDSPQEEAPDPAANLTFNLSLSDKEKEDRANLVLPYMQAGRPKAPVGSGSAKIFYQPDDADDFDEEDPDEDLNI